MKTFLQYLTEAGPGDMGGMGGPPGGMGGPGGPPGMGGPGDMGGMMPPMGGGGPPPGMGGGMGGPPGMGGGGMPGMPGAGVPNTVHAEPRSIWELWDKMLSDASGKEQPKQQEEPKNKNLMSVGI